MSGQHMGEGPLGRGTLYACQSKRGGQRVNGQRLGKVEEGHWGAAPFKTVSQKVEGGGSVVSVWGRVTGARHLEHLQGGTVCVREHKGCVTEGAGRG